ncbi:MAG: hypothetical protein FD145_920 [Candidatus Saganbacteria bacterium]|uniref:Photosynthesis system II assembly factor Ycf48/Hcf136-like domain-containing protein n=1 Tax=Candidatus Saganbacteria bacterium TaxID=2575572 RepID=A0A833NZV3_UNCSA|nr:MAG: hypothetical protein FD145_920 [Candidatus Saganbacteria bacterium]
MRHIRIISALIAVVSIFSSLSMAASRWSEQTNYSATSSANFYHNQFLDSSTGFICGSKGMFYKTTNAGVTWSKKTVDAAPDDKVIRALHFPTSQVGYLVGYDGGAAGVIYKTSDAGETWSGLDLPVGAAPYTIYDTHFVSATEGWICGNNSDIRVHKTTTGLGGENWTGCTVVANPETISFYGIYFLDMTTGWVVGDGGNVYKTTNGGSTLWTKQANGITAEDLNDIFFIDSSTGWIVGNGGRILKTTNGGTDWTPVSGISSTYALGKVHFLDSNTGWVVGAELIGVTLTPIILKTTNGGTSWSSETYSTTSWPTSVYAQDSNNAWIVGGFISPITPTSFIYKYVVDPTITTASPSTRYQGWSGNVTLTGTNLQSGVTLEVTKTGGSGITYTYTRNSATEIVVAFTVSSTATTGDWTIKTINLDGGSVETTFSVSTQPVAATVTRYHPTLGAVSWDSQGALCRQITVEGANFQSGATITMTGGVSVSATSFVSSAKLNANIWVSASETVGNKNLTVTNPDAGTSTYTNAFEIRTAAGGPTVTTYEVTNSEDVGASKKLKDFPAIKATITDATGLDPNTVRFAAYIPFASSATNAPEYYQMFVPATFTTLESAGGVATKAQVTLYLTGIKRFLTPTASETALNNLLITGNSKPIYLYVEDKESNPTITLYNSNVYCDFSATPLAAVPQALPSQVVTPANTIVDFQFESDKDRDNHGMQVFIAGVTGLISNHMVIARKVTGNLAKSLAAATGRQYYKVTLTMEDFNGHAPAVGIYRVVVKDRVDGDIATTGKIVFAPSKSN